MKKTKSHKKKEKENPESDDENTEEQTVTIQRPLLDESNMEVKPLQVFHKTGDRVFHEGAPKNDVSKSQNRPDATVLTQTADSEEIGALYKPKTQESKVAYEELLNFLNKCLPDQSHSFLADCAHFSLSILKNELIPENKKKEQLKSLIGNDNESYQHLKSLVKDITDFMVYKEQKNENDAVNLEMDIEDNAKRGVEFEVMDFQENLEADIQGSFEVEEQENNNQNPEEFIEKYNLENFIKNSGKTGVDTKDLKLKIIDLLRIQDEVEVQNKLFNYIEVLSMEEINSIFQNRYEIYFCTILKESNGSPETQQMILNHLHNNEELSLKLGPLIEFLENSGVSTETSQIGLKSAIDRLNSMKNEDFIRAPKKNVALIKNLDESISFANSGLKLPRDSIRKAQNDYEEICIPHKFKPQDEREKLLGLEAIPSYFQSAFSGDIKQFNRIQSRVFNFAFNSDKNMLLCAPTGAGKTVVSLFTILGLLNSYRNPETQIINLSQIKIVYLAPMKALVSEVVSTLNVRLNPLGIIASEFTGDVHLSLSEFKKSTIIVSTPEKWDVLSRKSIERSFSDNLKLLVVDEIHLLGDTRGAVIESLILRTLLNQNIRIVALSATLPNYEEVARFLNVDLNDGLFYFNNSYRPVPLTQHYIGISEPEGMKKRNLVNKLLLEKLSERVTDHQVLIFVHSRKETLKTAQDIKEAAFGQNIEELFVNENSKKVIEGIKSSLLSAELQEIITSGIGFHHAGLSRNDRSLVEDLFSGGHLSVLISTATLAWGVNLPAHTVIIKNTQVYSPAKGKWVPLSTQNLLQMLGRAGRPKFDNEGEGIIITSAQELRHYMSFLNEQEPIESHFLPALTEMLNSEIVLGNIGDFKTACKWLSRSYFFQRLRKNPKKYGILADTQKSEKSLVTFAIDAIHTAAFDLNAIGMIEYIQETGEFRSTEEGRVASFFYVRPENMRTYFNGLQLETNEIDLLRLFCLSSEFKGMLIRSEEKVELSRLYSSVPIPIKSPIEDHKSKVNVLLQCHISRVNLEGYALNCDMKFVSENAQRIFKAIFEIALLKKSGNALIVLDYCKMVERRVWKEMSPLRQFTGISSRAIQRIEQQEHLNFENFKSMSVSEINEIIRHEPTSQQIHSLLKKLPALEIRAMVHILSRNIVKVNLNFEANFHWDTGIHGNKQMFHVFVLDIDHEVTLYHQPFFIYRHDCVRFKEEKSIDFYLKISEPLPPHYFLKIVSDSWIVSDITLPISFRHLFLPAKFPMSKSYPEIDTEDNPNVNFPFLSVLLENKQLNTMQREVFPNIYQTFENLFLGATRNSGKFQMVLVALHQLYSQTKNAKSIIVFSNENELKMKQNQLEAFASNYGVSFSIFGGNLQKDVERFSNFSLILTTAAHFERVTRNYKKRVQLKQVRLVVALNLNALNERNSLYEVLLTRLRMVFSLLQHKYRLVAVSTPILNFSNVCDWLGIEPENAFNYSSDMLNNNIEVTTHSVEAFRSQSFLEITAKKLGQTHKSNLVIFTKDMETAQSFTSHFLKFQLGSETKPPFNEEKRMILNQVIENCSDMFNSHFLEHAAVCISSNTTDEEINLYSELLKLNNIDLMVCPKGDIYRLGGISVANIFVIEAAEFSSEETHFIFGLLNKMKTAEDLRETSSIEEEKTETMNLHAYLHDWEKEFFKNILLGPVILESQLGKNFIEVLNVEIASGVIKEKQECVDWLTWTFFYRRLSSNPNYYNLLSNNQREINEEISKIVDAGLEDLKEFNCVEISENEISRESIGTVSSFYDISPSIVSSMAKNINQNFTWRNMFSIIAFACDLESFDLSENQINYLENLNEQVPFQMAQENLRSSEFKVSISVQVYLSRLQLQEDVESELKRHILPNSFNIIDAFVDCASLSLSLKPALIAMKTSQMLTQRLWNTDNTLMQLPFFGKELIQKAESLNVISLENFFFIEEGEREILLEEFTESQKQKIANSSNSFPNIELEASITDDHTDYEVGDKISIKVEIKQALEGEEVPSISKMGILKDRPDSWWLVVADRRREVLFYAKKIQIGLEFTNTFGVSAVQEGNFSLSVLLISDSCIGFDVEVDDLEISISNE